MVLIKNVTHINKIGIQNINEDRILVDETKHLFGVFDGASSLVSYASPDGKTGGYLAASIVADTFSGSDLNLKATALQANDRIEKVQSEANVDLSNNVNRFGTTAAVVKIRSDTADLLQIGDSIIIVIDTTGNATVPLGYLDHDIIAMRKWRQFADQGAQNIRELVWDDVLKQREVANIGYGALNGDDKLKDHIRTATIPLSNVATILLLTDGMFLPKADPDEDDNWNEYANCYRKSGLVGLFKLVRDTEKDDPTLVKYPRFKLHDDSSGIAVDFVH
jgi:serine/threonine protein phosphatase PrpC